LLLHDGIVAGRLSCDTGVQRVLSSASSVESIARHAQPPSSRELDSTSREVGTRSRSFDCKSRVFVSEYFKWMLSSRNSELENVLSLWREGVDLAGTKLAATI
ncbi:hypothetical protein S83_057529, partial [Arachis hypogaea]